MPSPQIEDGHLDLNGGYVRLYRKTLESSVFQNPVTLKIWIWCLLKANHKGRSVSVRTGRGETLVRLQPGQFIFGRNSAAKELNLPASTIHDVMVRFRKTGNLTIFPDSHYSIISISKWSDYQAENPTGIRQATDRQTQIFRQATGQAISDEKTENQDRQPDRQKNEHPQKTDTNNNTRIFKERNKERKRDFDKSLVSLFSEIESDYKPENLQHKQEFLDYWTEKNSNGKKERWQMEKVFDVKRRFKTWLRNHKRWSGRDAIEHKAQETAKILKNWGSVNA